MLKIGKEYVAILMVLCFPKVRNTKCAIEQKFQYHHLFNRRTSTTHNWMYWKWWCSISLFIYFLKKIIFYLLFIEHRLFRDPVCQTKTINLQQIHISIKNSNSARKKKFIQQQQWTTTQKTWSTNNRRYSLFNSFVIDSTLFVTL